MFILINYGYNSRKIYTIDCLAAAVFDCIWQNCYQNLHDLYIEKESLFKKQAEAHQKKIIDQTKKLQQIQQKIKTEEQNNPDKKKDDKKAVKKGGKGDPVPSSPLQQEKFDTQKQITFSKTALTKYTQKISQLNDLKCKLTQTKSRIQKGQLYVQLVDKTGQRKFIRNKLKMQANQFLTDRGIYYLCTVAVQNQQEQVEALTHDGFPVRTVEQDTEVSVDEIVFTIKKQDKGKKGGKKK